MTNLLTILIPILIICESGSNSQAVGDNGNAVGILQIWTCVVSDVNRVAGTSYTNNDRFDVQKSVQMCRIYLTHYCRPARLGREPTLEDLARCWNGGPNGYRKKSTKKYWRKCRKLLDNHGGPC